jgi:MFS family permease
MGRGRQAGAARHNGVESRYAWMRLIASIAISAIGNVGMWSVVVALPAVQAEFGVARADASLPYTLTMVSFGIGGIVMGRWTDRMGVARPVTFGTLALGLGMFAASMAGTLWQFALAQGLFIGIGASTFFSPLMADISHWFERRRGIAVALCASGSYLAGTIWPPVVQHFISTVGWRQTYVGIAVFCVCAVLPLLLLMRRPSPVGATEGQGTAAASMQARPLGFSPRTLQILLLIAGTSCCVAMSMPQVHLVAYCADLGYGPARGAEMLSVMLACGIVSRLVFGWISDSIGGVRTLLIGSALQGLALFLFLPFNGLVSLYLISALFRLFQGGIVPSYAIIIREHFPANEAGARVGAVITATMFGMALGGWMSGAIFDLTGSYRAAFLNGIGWNAVNVVIALWLLRRAMPRHAFA